MKPLGRRKMRRTVAGHQECGICHPETKSGAARDRFAARRDVAALTVPECQDCGLECVCLCDGCLAPHVYCYCDYDCDEGWWLKYAPNEPPLTVPLAAFAA